MSEEETSGQTFLIGLLITTIILGILVIIVKPDFRIEQITLSNQDYYPQIQIITGEE